LIFKLNKLYFKLKLTPEKNESIFRLPRGVIRTKWIVLDLHFDAERKEKSVTHPVPFFAN
jgi:hypothetical protein